MKCDCGGNLKEITVSKTTGNKVCRCDKCKSVIIKIKGGG